MTLLLSVAFGSVGLRRYEVNSFARQLFDCVARPIRRRTVLFQHTSTFVTRDVFHNN